MRWSVYIAHATDGSSLTTYRDENEAIHEYTKAVGKVGVIEVIMSEIVSGNRKITLRHWEAAYS